MEAPLVIRTRATKGYARRMIHALHEIAAEKDLSSLVAPVRPDACTLDGALVPIGIDVEHCLGRHEEPNVRMAYAS